MFDIAPTELLLCAIVALLVIGPKDLPKAMRVVGHWVGRARGMARHFRSGFDNMVREAELEEMERKWAAENERIMREHPSEPDAQEPVASEPAVTEPVIPEPITTEAPVPDGSTPDEAGAAKPRATRATKSAQAKAPQLDLGLDGDKPA